MSDSPTPTNPSPVHSGSKRYKESSPSPDDKAIKRLALPSMMAEDGPLSGTVGSHVHVHIQVPTYPDIEEDIQRLRYQRLKERENALYIPPQGKPTLQSSDDTLFPLTEKVLEFLTGPGMVLLLLGDSGGGKSTFNLQLEHILWKEYKRGGPIPLHINLPTIDQPQQNMIIKRLHQLNFSDLRRSLPGASTNPAIYCNLRRVRRESTQKEPLQH